MARYWGQQKEEALTTVGGGSENLQGVSASDRKRWDGKQDQLVYDNKPMRGSVNILNSDAVARAFEEFKDAISTAYKQYLSTQVTSYAEMVTAVTNAKNDVDNAYVAIEKYETNMRVLYEDTLSKLTDAQNILAGATTLLNKTNTESSALSAKIKQLESVHSSIISALGVLRNALANVEKDTDHANIRIEELISKANDVDARVADLVKTVEDTLAEIETEKEDTLAKIRAVRDSIPEDYEKVCEDVKEVRQELIDARRRGTWITSETASGEMVHATGCAPVPPLNISLFGNSEQKQYGGHQMFNASHRGTHATKPIYCNNCTVEEYNEIFYITAASADMCVWETLLPGTVYNDVQLSNLMKIPEGATQISLALSNVELNKNYLTFYDADKVCLGSKVISSNIGTIDVLAGAEYVVLRFGKGDAVVGKTYETTVMVNIGEPMDWEPYTGGEPSPSIRYPQHIVSTGQKLIGNQLFDGTFENVAGSTNGVLIESALQSAVVSITGGSTYTISLETADIIFTCTTSDYPSVGVGIVDTYAGTAGAKVLNKTITTSATAKYLVIGFSAFANIHQDTLMVSKGNTVRPLEPYTGGKEQVYNTGSITQGLYSENLFDINSATKNCCLKWGLGTLSQGENKSIVSDFIPVQKGIQYISNYKFQLFYYNANKEYVGEEPNMSFYSFTIEREDVKFVRLGFRYAYNNSIDMTQVTDIVVNIGDTVLPWSVYAEPQFLTVLTPNGLKGIGAVRDYVDFARGKFVQRIKEVNLSDLTWDKAWNDHFAIDETFIVYAQIEDMITHVDVFLTHFSKVNNLLTSAEIGFNTGEGNRSLGIRVPTSVASNLDEWNEWCASSGAKFTYILTDPVETDLTEEEMTQYSKLCMNYPDTLVMNDAGAFIEVEYGKDAEAYINENYTPRSEHEALEQRVKIIEEEIIKL